ncbi:MAG: acyltransferase family protein [Actinomycetota bacterium]
MSDRSPRSSTHLPGLDGLRGVAVIMVLVFHSGLGWLPGGFLGVSIFFTLSGFLITSLLLGEIESSGRIGLGSFWSRRLRRLLPASLAAITLAVVIAPWLTTAVEEGRLRGDAVAGVLYASNWRYVSANVSYEELFATVSPLLHLWSLAIEAQLYLVLPIVIMIASSTRLRRRGIGVVLAGCAVASAVGSAVFLSGDRLYYGTDARAAELLAGAVLACWWRPPDQRLAEPHVAGRVWTRWIPLGACAAVLIIARVTTTSSDWVYSGALAGFALLSVVLVAGAVESGPLRRLLEYRGLTIVGTVSYGLYLYHWPIFVWMTSDRVGLDGVALFAVQLAATAAVSATSYLILESPVRRRRILASGRIAAPAALVVAVALPFVWLDAHRTTVQTTERVLTTVPPTTAGSGSAAETLRILVIGDSTAENLARAFADAADPSLGVISGGVIGCPLLLAAEVFDRPGGTQDSAYCPDNLRILADNADSVDAVVIVAGVANQWDRRPRDGAEVIEVGGDDYRRDFANWMEEVQSVLAPTGIPVVVFDSPTTRTSDDVLGDEPEAVAAWNEVITTFDDTWISVVRLGYSRFLSDPNSEAGRRERPDGVHLDRDVAADLARRELVPALFALYADVLREMESSGCRIAAVDGGSRLDLERCRARDLRSP